MHKLGTKQFEDSINEGFMHFTARLRASAIPYTQVHTVVNEVDELLTTVVRHLREKTSRVAEAAGQPDIVNNHLEKDYQAVQNVAKTFKSRHKQDKYFIEKGVLITPEEKTVGTSFVSQHVSSTGRTKQTLHKDTYQYVPIQKILTKHLEQPGVLSSILNEQQCQDSNVLKTYRDGSYFKSKYNDIDNKDVRIPLLLYCDDFETGNPLGSKKGENKLVAFYISVLCLPLEYQSNLNNILVAACCRRKIVDKCGIDEVSSSIVDDLLLMEEKGLEISCVEFTGTVLPFLFQVIGDNLGIHELLGYVGSFSANFPCRFCKAPKEIVHEQLEEDTSLLRNKNTFEEDLSMGDASKTGLKRSSELNRLECYHTSQNYAPDTMHDFLEGVMPIAIKLTIKTLIEQEHFSLEELNNRSEAFNYGYVDKKK